MKAVLICVCVAALTITSFGADKKLWAKSVIGQKAPEFVVEKWLTPEPDTKGKFVLIDFWATWCGPCRKAIPELSAFQKKFGDKLVVIGVSDETEEKVNKLTDPKVEYASAIDTRGRMKKTLEVKGIPHCIIIDPTGIVRWEGFPFLDGHELTEKVIADILATSTDAKSSDGIPYAIAVPGKPGFVYSPHDQSKGYIDVRGFPPGTEVKDPYSAKSFRVP